MIPYLNSKDVHPLMSARPGEDFFLRPADYQVVDGDTIRVLSAERTTQGFRAEAFSLRFRSIAAPEKPKRGPTDASMLKAGIDVHDKHPGRLAKRGLAELLKDRVILVQPRGADRYRRLLCDIAVSGRPGKMFHTGNAMSVEHCMLDRKLVTPFKAEERLPPYRPQILEHLDDYERARQGRESSQSPDAASKPAPALTHEPIYPAGPRPPGM